MERHEKFRALRKKLGLSVDLMAKLCDRHPVTIRRWETDPLYSSARSAPAYAFKLLAQYLPDD